MDLPSHMTLKSLQCPSHKGHRLNVGQLIRSCQSKNIIKICFWVTYLFISRQYVQYFKNYCYFHINEIESSAFQFPGHKKWNQTE